MKILTNKGEVKFYQDRLYTLYDAGEGIKLTEFGRYMLNAPSKKTLESLCGSIGHKFVELVDNQIRDFGKFHDYDVETGEAVLNENSQKEYREAWS